jgi:hypothetical protein
MAGLKIFVSSTCYDLSVIRSQLRVFIQSLGHEPIMSDYSDILYDPRIHTHTSCVEEVATSDIVVLIVGSRFGGKSVPEAISKIDFDNLNKESRSIESLKERENLSVTQLEILKAIDSGIPVFTFIDSSVWHDHALYVKNKDKDIISQIDFPSIEKPKTAAFIFEFINFLRHRHQGNSVFQFSKSQDIEEILKRQWSILLQRLLQEQKNRLTETKRIDNLSEQLEDLKTAILTSVGSIKEREVARGVVKFRRLIEFITLLDINKNFILSGNPTWKELLAYADIDSIIDTNNMPEFMYRNMGARPRMFLVKSDKTFYELRISPDFFYRFSLEWQDFISLNVDTRTIIIEALSEIRPSIGVVRYRNESFENFIEEKNKNFDYSEFKKINVLDEKEIPLSLMEEINN